MKKEHKLEIDGRFISSGHGPEPPAATEEVGWRLAEGAAPRLPGDDTSPEDAIRMVRGHEPAVEQAEPVDERIKELIGVVRSMANIAGAAFEGDEALREALEEIADRDVWEKSEVDDEGETHYSCRWCFETHGNHYDDCVVLIARKALGTQEPDGTT